MTTGYKLPMFSKENFNIWKARMKSHLGALDDDMWHVITNGPIKIMKAGTSTDAEGGSQLVEKPRSEWTTEDKRKNNLDNIAIDSMHKTLDDNMMSKVITCKNAKEVWDKLAKLYEGNEQTKENKLMAANQKYETIRMKPGETMAEFDERFSSIVVELITLGKELGNKELASKVLRTLPKEWDIKAVAMREAKDLNNLELHDLFTDLKAYKCELKTRSEEAVSYNPTHALMEKEQTEASTSTTKMADQLSNEVMALFMKKFDKFKKGN